MSADLTSRDVSTQRAVLHRLAGDWPEALALDSVTLDFDDRHRRRIRLVTDGGGEVLLDLPTTIAMGDRDGLQLENGTWLIVRAAGEPVVDVRHTDPGQIVRLAWHLGNRHIPTEIRNQVLRIRPDHVIEAMLNGFGATLVELVAPFQPEGGAYGSHRHGGHHGSTGHDEEP